MQPDVVIPDLPKVVGHAAQHGRSRRWRCAAEFRNGMLQLAREVAFVRLLDSGARSDGSGDAGEHGLACVGCSVATIMS